MSFLNLASLKISQDAAAASLASVSAAEVGALWTGQVSLSVRKSNGKASIIQEDDPETLRGILGPANASCKLLGVSMYAADAPNTLVYVNDLLNYSGCLAGARAGYDTVRQSIWKNASLQDVFKAQRQAVSSAWFHHDFLIFTVEAPDDSIKYVGLEKFAHAIVFRVENDKKELMESNGNEKRTEGGKFVFQEALVLDECVVDNSVGDILDWIFSEKELEKKYICLPAALGGDHCQHFADRALARFARSKRYPNTMLTTQIFFQDAIRKIKEQAEEEIRQS